MRAVYGLSILTNVVLAGLLVASAPLIAKLFGEPRLTAVIMVLACQFVISSLAVIPDAMIKRSLDFRAVASIEVAQGLLAAASSLVLAWFGFGVWALVAATVVGTAVRTTGLLWASPFRAWPSFRFKGLGETLIFGGHITGQRVLWWAYTSFDKFMLGRVFDTHTLGLYSVAQHLAYLPLEKLGSTIAVASFTGLSRVATDRATFQTYLLKGLRLLSLVGLPIFLGLAAVAQDLVPLLLGAKWAPAAPIVATLCMVMPLRMLNGPLLESLNSLGRPNLGVIVTAVTAVLVVCCVAIGIHWGPIGVASAWVAGFAVGFCFTTVFVARTVGVKLAEIVRAVGPAAFAAAAMLGTVMGARGLLAVAVSSLPSLMASVALGATVYLAIITLVDRPGLRLVLSMVKRS